MGELIHEIKRDLLNYVEKITVEFLLYSKS